MTPAERADRVRVVLNGAMPSYAQLRACLSNVPPGSVILTADEQKKAEARIAGLEADLAESRKDRGYKFAEQVERIEQLQAEVASLGEAGDALATVAAQYFDTGRGDLDGMVDRWRALAGGGQ